MVNGRKSICSELQQCSHEVLVTAEYGQEAQSFGRLNLFESRALPKKNGGMAYVGGPVSAIEFHPTVKGVCAVAAHRTEQLTHAITSCYRGSAHIQLWYFGDDEPRCLAVIPHRGDCTWDLKWKPQTDAERSGDAEEWTGTLAAVLGDGTVLVSYIDTSKQAAYPPAGSPVKEIIPPSVLLRGDRDLLTRFPVRVVEWSPDGKTLLVGVADGSIEVYDTSNAVASWPYWVMPGHESVIVDLRWISNVHFCSLDLSCTLRLRNVSDPVGTLEQNAEGLSGSRSLEVIEPNVVVVGGDYGYLRFVRLSGIDGVAVSQPVKRAHLQAGAFADIKSLPVLAHKTTPSLSVLYTGGAEGILHECTIPRPVWAAPDTCNINSTNLAQTLRWVAERTPDGRNSLPKGDCALHLKLGPGFDQDETIVKTPSPSAKIPAQPDASTPVARPPQTPTRPSRVSKARSRRLKTLGKPNDGKDYSLFGERYSALSGLTRLSVSTTSDRLTAGSSGGFVVYKPLQLDQHTLVDTERGAARDEKAARATRTHDEPRSILKPLRKRGRPRKSPATPTNPSPLRAAGTIPTPTANTAATTVGVAVNNVDGAKHIVAHGVTVPEENLNKASPRRNARRAKSVTAPASEPRRKRGRPRKVVAADTDKGLASTRTKRRKTSKMDGTEAGNANAADTMQVTVAGLNEASTVPFVDTMAMNHAAAKAKTMRNVTTNATDMRNDVGDVAGAKDARQKVAAVADTHNKVGAAKSAPANIGQVSDSHKDTMDAMNACKGVTTVKQTRAYTIVKRPERVAEVPAPAAEALKPAAKTREATARQWKPTERTPKVAAATLEPVAKRLRLCATTPDACTTTPEHAARLPHSTISARSPPAQATSTLVDATTRRKPRTSALPNSHPQPAPHTPSSLASALAVATQDAPTLPLPAARNVVAQLIPSHPPHAVPAPTTPLLPPQELPVRTPPPAPHSPAQLKTMPASLYRSSRKRDTTPPLLQGKKARNPVAISSSSSPFTPPPPRRSARKRTRTLTRTPTPTHTQTSPSSPTPTPPSSGGSRGQRELGLEDDALVLSGDESEEEGQRAKPRCPARVRVRERREEDEEKEAEKQGEAVLVRLQVRESRGEGQVFVRLRIRELEEEGVSDGMERVDVDEMEEVEEVEKMKERVEKKVEEEGGRTRRQRKLTWKMKG